VRALISMAASGNSNTPNVAGRLWPWLVASMAIACASLLLGWLVGFAFFWHAWNEILPGKITGLVLSSIMFASWALGLLWCVLVLLAVARFGARAIWLATASPLVLFGPVPLALLFFMLGRDDAFVFIFRQHF
jgi:hypothetical protein